MGVIRQTNGQTCLWERAPAKGTLAGHRQRRRPCQRHLSGSAVPLRPDDGRPAARRLVLAPGPGGGEAVWTSSCPRPQPRDRRRAQAAGGSGGARTAAAPDSQMPWWRGSARLAARTWGPPRSGPGVRMRQSERRPTSFSPSSCGSATNAPSRSGAQQWRPVCSTARTVPCITTAGQSARTPCRRPVQRSTRRRRRRATRPGRPERVAAPGRARRGDYYCPPRCSASGNPTALSTSSASREWGRGGGWRATS